ncbi:MAG: hypothetical protein U0641_10695 [Anaerolineae bacterium]
MLHGNTYRWRALAALTVVVMLVALMAVLVGAQPTQAQGQVESMSNFRVLPPSSNPYGLSYSQWSVKWWQWAIGTPYSKSPLNSNLKPAAPCGTDQSGPVFFLGGALGPGDNVHRDCAVPLGKALLMPIINVEWDEEGVTTPLTVVQLGQTAKSITDHTTDRSITVDGVPIPDNQIYRIPSPVFFTYTMSATDNLYNLKCTGTLNPKCRDSNGPVNFPGLICAFGKCTAIAMGDGYYVMLAPLTAGDHVIHFHGRFTTEFDGVQDITYHLCVGKTTCNPIPS